jgi:tetratricopeptide (TPR) repeat protein
LPATTWADVLDGVNRDSPLSYRRILIWAQQILEGLQTIHAANVVHGDIKPQNVLIGPNDEAKLVDFGTSRRLEDVWVWTRRQGTEAYWAPEVAFEEQRGLVSDIYSVGIMLYEMVVGELPYKSPFQLASSFIIKRPREVNPNTPSLLETIIMRAIARDPEDRYASCADMLNDVNSLIEDIDAGALALPPDRTKAAKMPFRPDSSSPLYYLEEAKTCLSTDDLSGARQAAEVAVDRSDGHPNYLRLLGSIYVRMAYPIRAMETYERVLAAYDNDFPATPSQIQDVLERLGRLYIQTKRYQRAVKTYERLLTITDHPTYIRFKLAMACGLDADYRRAIKLLEKVRQDRPDAAIVYSKLGWACMLDGDTRQALSYYNQALLIDDADLLSLFELGRYYWIIGDRSRARGYFERVRVHDRQGDYQARVRQILGE